MPDRTHFPRRLLLPGFVLILAALACQIVNPTPVSWTLTETAPAGSAEIETGQPSTTQPPVITLNPFRTPERPSPTLTSTQQTPDHTPIPQTPDNPALIYFSGADHQLVLHRLHGGADERLDLPAQLLAGTDLQQGLSPDGQWLAFRTGGDGFSSLGLQLLDTRSGTLNFITPLLNPALEDQIRQGEATARQAAAVAADPLGLAWSPDGRYLAYIGAVDGPSTDLYVYDTQRKTSTRLTHGSNQAASPFWSPDSRWIIHQEIRYSAEGTPQVTAVWESSPTQPEMRRLYTPSQGSLGEVFLGWTESGNLLVYSRTAEAFRDLREIPLSARWIEPVYTRPFAGAAFDPISRLVAIVQSSRTSPGSGLAPGVYSLPLRTTDVQQVQEGSWENSTWYASPGTFAVSGPLGALLFSPHEAPLALNGENQAVPSPNGQWLAGFGDSGARLYQPDGTRLQEWLKKPVWQAAWLPDSSGLYLLGEAGLYLALFPEAQAELVAEGVPAGAAALISGTP